MPKMDIEEIKKIIPHRHPFLLVDQVLEIEPDRILAVKNVSVNEDYFNGHFPGAPMMPGVLQIEAMAQSGCIMLMNGHVDDTDKYLLVFTGINKAKFRKSVVPGDQLRMEVELLNKRRNFVTMGGKATVNGEVVCELEASAAIVPREERL